MQDTDLLEIYTALIQKCPVCIVSGYCIMYFTLGQSTSKVWGSKGRVWGREDADDAQQYHRHGYTLCRCSAHLLSLLPAKSTLLEKVLHNIFLLLLNGQGQTCVTIVVHIKLHLTKYWNEVLHQFQLARVSSKMEGIHTILLMQYGHTYVNSSIFEHNTRCHDYIKNIVTIHTPV